MTLIWDYTLSILILTSVLCFDYSYMCTLVDVNSSTFGQRPSFEPQNCLWLPQEPITGITGIIAFLSTIVICLLYKVNISVGIPCLLSSGSYLNLLGLDQRFSLGQKFSTAPFFLCPIRVLFYHLKAKGSHPIHLSARTELPPFSLRNEKEQCIDGVQWVHLISVLSKVWEWQKDTSFENDELCSDIIAKLE